MYLEHFKLKKFPFTMASDIGVFLPLSNWGTIFTESIKAINMGLPIIVITGDAGAGKTLQCRKLLKSLKLHPRRYKPFFLDHPAIPMEEFFQILDQHMTLPQPKAVRKSRGLKPEKAEQTGPEQERNIILIEEAQHLHEKTLRRLIGSLNALNESGEPGTLQLVLYGTEELKLLLDSMVEDRDSCYFQKLKPISRSDAGLYCQNRLAKAGYDGPPLFTEQALDLLYEFSKGNPGLTNLLAHKSLLSAYGQGGSEILHENMQHAVNDTQFMHSC